MGFSQDIKNKILVLSARHCCVCHRYKGVKVEIHHIKPQADGGEDTLENAIALCFDCHADAGHYNPKHPKGLKLSQGELKLQKENWFKIVNENNISTPKPVSVELIINNKNFRGKFNPIFIKEKTKFRERDSFKRIYEIMGKDPMESVNEMKKNNVMGPMYMPFLNSIKTYDEYIDFLNGDYPKKDFLKTEDENENNDCQPIRYNMPDTFGYLYNEVNRSNCVIDLKFINTGSEVLENYKLYLTFENVVNLELVSKRTSWSDMSKYYYNVNYLETNKVEFVPQQSVLVQNDSVTIDSLCFRTKHKTKEVNLKWELFARNMHNEGILKLEIKPSFEIKEIERFVNGASDMKPIQRILPKIDLI